MRWKIKALCQDCGEYRLLNQPLYKLKKPVWRCHECVKKALNITSLTRYGLTHTTVNKLRLAAVACPICLVGTLTETQLVLDHDHKVNEARGFICGTCNTLLGMAKDNIERLERAIEYLRNPPLKALVQQEKQAICMAEKSV